MADSYEAQLRAYELEFQKQQEKLAEKQRAEEEKARKAEDERIRKEEQQRRALEEKQRREEAEAQKREEERLKREEERKRKEDEQRSKEEARRAEEARKAEEERVRKEEERKRKEEEARQREEERRQKAEEERLRKDEERKRKEDEARQKAEEERRKQDALNQKRAEEKQAGSWQKELKEVEAAQAKLRKDHRREERRRAVFQTARQKEHDAENQRVSQYQDILRKEKADEDALSRKWDAEYEQRRAVLSSEADIEQRKAVILGGGAPPQLKARTGTVSTSSSADLMPTPRSMDSPPLRALDAPPPPSPRTLVSSNSSADLPTSSTSDLHIDFPENPPEAVEEDHAAYTSAPPIAATSSSFSRSVTDVKKPKEDERVVRVNLHPKDKLVQSLDLGSYKMIAITTDTTSAKLESLMVEKLCRTVPTNHHPRIKDTCQKYRMHGVDKAGKTSKLKPAQNLWSTTFVAFAFF